MKNQLSKLIYACLFLYMSCDKAEDLGLQDNEPSAASTALQEEKLELMPTFTEDYRLHLQWPNIRSSDSKVSFQVYEQFVEDATSIQQLNLAEDKSNNGFRALKSIKANDIASTIRPSKRGRLIASLGSESESYTFENRLNLDKSYAYEVIVKIDGKEVELNNAYIVFVEKLIPEKIFNGCKKFTALDDKSMQIDFEFPQNAKELSIYRSGVKVFNTYNASSTQFIDKNLAEGTQYEYTCAARVGPVEIFHNGQNAITLDVSGETPTKPVLAKIYRQLGSNTTNYFDQVSLPNDDISQSIDDIAGASSQPDPFANVTNYLGCTDVTVLSSSQVTINFQFPVEAVDASIFRNGIQVFSTDDKKLTTFTDTGLIAGATYYYSCRIHKNGITKRGTQTLTATTSSVPTVIEVPNPLDGVTYNGCTNSTVLSSSSIKVDFHFPAAAEEASIYRNGIKIFATDDQSLNSFVDTGLIPDTSYYYSCRVQNKDKTLKGSATLTAKTNQLSSGDLNIANPLDDVVGYNGCLAAVALDAARVKVDFEFPAEGESVSIYRNGIVVFSVEDRSWSSFTDTGLSEGTSYLYTCKVHNGDKSLTGLQNFTVTTPTVNPPTFKGVNAVNLVDSNKIRLSWQSPSALGVAATQYKIFMQVLKNESDTTAFDWGVAYTTKSADGNEYYDVPRASFGDGLSYRFGVRACSSAGDCDNNEILKQINIGDLGSSKNPVISLSLTQSRIIVSAPWTFTDGQISKRKIYWSTDGTSYSFAQEYNVTNNLLPSESMMIQLPLSEGNTYYIRLDDIDSANNVASSNIQNIYIDDVSPPQFLGITDIVAGTPADQALQLSFTAAAADQGVENYAFYILALDLNATGNACTNGTLLKNIIASNFSPGANAQYNLDGLQSRQKYSVCMKALDAKGNVSTNSAGITTYTKDITPPSFSGLTVVDYDIDQKQFLLSWQSTNSADLKEYKVEFWTNDYSARTTLMVAANNSNTIGATISNNLFPAAENTTYRILVNACDNASPLYGTQNCSTYGEGNAFVFATQDLTPPPGFSGVISAIDVSEGMVQVGWSAPANWNDYRGFKIYDIVNNQLVLLKDCPCSASNCPERYTSCQVEVDPYRDYTFYATAYDVVGNQAHFSPYLSQSVGLKTVDSTAPSFSSTITLGPAPQFRISWSAASDNQYDPAAKINYTVYRKVGADFNDPTNPKANLISDPTNVTSIPALTNLSVMDTGTITEGEKYYYTVCAQDSTANAKCLGFSELRQITDATPPLLSYFTSTKIVDEPGWTMKWGVADAVSPLAELSFEIYRTQTEIPEDPEMIDLNLFNYSTGESLNCIGYCELKGQTGPSGATRYLNYKLIAYDKAGNSVTSNTVSVLSEGKIFEVTSIVRESGPLSGGSMVLVNGNGFKDGATVSMGSDTCTRTDFVSSSQLICITAATAIPGARLVVVTNPDGLNNQVPVVTYEYTGAGHPCNDETLRIDTVNFAGGSGTQPDPYLICTVDQLKVVKSNLNSSFQLIDHMDMTTVSNWESFRIATSTPFSGNFKGDTLSNGEPKFWIYKMLLNNVTNGSNMGFFGITSGNGQIADLRFHKAILNLAISNESGIAIGRAQNNTIKNIIITESTVSGGGHNIGGALGFIESNTSIDNVDFLNGTVLGNSGTYAIGGIIGSVSANIANGMEIKSCDSSGVLSGNYDVGGIVGYSKSSQSGLLSFSTSTMTINGIEDVGGLIGENDTYDILSSHYNGQITGKTRVGGLVGYQSQYGGDTYILKSFSKGKIFGLPAGGSVGGLVGQMQNIRAGDTSIDQSFSLVDIESSASTVGGLVGFVYGYAYYPRILSISNSYFQGSISAQDIVGGLVGDCNRYLSISRSYSKASITTLFGTEGGICGSFVTVATINNSFWDSTSYANTSISGSGSPTVNNSSIKTAEELQDPAMVDYTAGPSPWEATKWNLTIGAYPSLKNNAEPTP